MIEMKYIGRSCSTIKHGTKGILIKAEKVDLSNPMRAKYFPSGLALAFKLKDGCNFGWCDRKEWVKIKNK